MEAHPIIIIDAVTKKAEKVNHIAIAVGPGHTRCKKFISKWDYE